MRIGLEVVLRPDWPAGIIYIRNLVYALAALPPDEVPEVVLLPLDEPARVEVADLGRRFVFVEVAAPRLGPHALRVASFKARRLIRKVLQPRADRVLHPAFGGLDLTYPEWAEPIPGVPQVAWIQDLQHVHLPHMFSADEIRERDEWVARIAQREGMVIFSSEAAKADFLALHPRPRVFPRVWRFCTTITEAEKGGAEPRSTLGLSTSYIYVANQFWAHKDHLTLFRALAILAERGLRPTVVCTGKMEDYRNPDYVRSIRSFIAEHGLEEQITILGFLSRRDQIEVLRCCSGVVQPSRFEGWSTVVEDAKAVGRPMVLSDIEVHKEQYEEALPMSYFATGSPEALADVLAELIPQWSPGPDLQAESRAEELARERRERAARAFLEIAGDVVASGG